MKRRNFLKATGFIALLTGVGVTWACSQELNEDGSLTLKNNMQYK